jgi:hypothetical protein
MSALTNSNCCRRQIVVMNLIHKENLVGYRSFIKATNRKRQHSLRRASLVGGAASTFLSNGIDQGVIKTNHPAEEAAAVAELPELVQ